MKSKEGKKDGKCAFYYCFPVKMKKTIIKEMLCCEDAVLTAASLPFKGRDNTE